MSERSEESEKGIQKGSEKGSEAGLCVERKGNGGVCYVWRGIEKGSEMESELTHSGFVGGFDFGAELIGLGSMDLRTSGEKSLVFHSPEHIYS